MATELVILDCACCARADLAAVNLLARKVLATRRRGCECRLTNVHPALLELLDFSGLAEVLCVEMQRQAEEWEEPLGVQEEGELGDPSVL